MADYDDALHGYPADMDREHLEAIEVRRLRQAGSDVNIERNGKDVG
jgi:hypothetical protein